MICLIHLTKTQIKEWITCFRAFSAPEPNALSVRPSLTFHIFYFSETAEQNSTKLNRKQDLSVLCQVCIFGSNRKNKMAARPLTGWDIFSFPSETNERNYTKLDRKIWTSSTKFVFFGPIGKTRKPPWHLIDLSLSTPMKPLNGIQWNLTGSNISTSSTKFVFFEPIGETRWPPGLWLAETFLTSPLKPLNGIQRNLIGSKIWTSSTLFVFFRAYRKTKKVALVSGCPRHFRLFLWNSWSEFNETWQEVRSQGPLPNLCLSDRSKIQVGRPCRLSTKVSHCTQVHDMWPFGSLVQNLFHAIVLSYKWIPPCIYSSASFSYASSTKFIREANCYVKN